MLLLPACRHCCAADNTSNLCRFSWCCASPGHTAWECSVMCCVLSIHVQCKGTVHHIYTVEACAGFWLVLMAVRAVLQPLTDGLTLSWILSLYHALSTNSGYQGAARVFKCALLVGWCCVYTRRCCRSCHSTVTDSYYCYTA
jgi:hypothetical protein